MNKIKLFLLLFFAIALFALASCGLLRQPDYFPLTIGSEWSYTFGKDELRYKVIGEEEIDGAICSIVEITVNKVPAQREYYSKTNKKLMTIMRTYDEDKMRIKLNPPETQMQLPLKAGGKWRWTGKAENTGKMTINFKVTKKEKITVPAGTFDAIKIEREGIISAGKTISSQRWYAPNIGMIKEVSQLGPISVTSELTGYNIMK